MQRSCLLAPMFCLVLQAQGTARLKLGDPAPAFRLPSTRGTLLDLKEIKGPFVVVWLSTQCPYVLGSEGRINALARAYQGRVAFIGVNSNESESAARREEGLAGMKAHAAKAGYVFPYVKDEGQDVIKAYGAICTPDFFLFDAGGRLAYRGRMDDNTTPRKDGAITRHDLREAIEAVLAGRLPDPDQKPSRGCSIKWKGE